MSGDEIIIRLKKVKELIKENNIIPSVQPTHAT